MGYDDSLAAFGVPGIGGIVGALLTGVFAAKDIGGVSGMLEGNGGQVMIQLIGVGATVVYTAVASFIILKVIDMVIGLRVSEEEEREGLDVSLHGEHVD
jgi:Amt family ammonium transporter